MTDGATTIHREWLTGRVGDWVDWRSRVTFPSRAQVLELAVQLARPVTGHIIEFGVWKGYSTRVIRMRPGVDHPAPARGEPASLRRVLRRGPRGAMRLRRMDGENGHAHGAHRPVRPRAQREGRQDRSTRVVPGDQQPARGEDAASPARTAPPPAGGSLVVRPGLLLASGVTASPLRRA